MDRPNHFMIQPHKDHFILVNIKGKREHHTHIWTKKTCNTLIGLVCKKTVPTSDYLKESAKRISRDEKYIDKINRKIKKDEDKQSFHKVNNGLWR